MNKVFLIGNLTRDPELTQTPSGVAVCHFSIAVNRTYQSANGERQTDFFNCTAWRILAERIAQYAKKGKKVAVGGSIQLRTYEDNNGVQRNAVDIIVQDCEFLSPKDDNGGSYDAAPSPAKSKPVLQMMDDDGSDIPF